MSGFTTQTVDHLTRTTLFSNEIKEQLREELMGMRYVRMMNEFADGSGGTMNIPSLGQMEALDYVEGNAVKYNALDTGNFTFTTDQYKQAGTYMTNKFKQDSWKSAMLMSRFVPEMTRALMVQIENKVMSVGPAGQTASNSNTINDGKHRMVGSGTNEQMTIEDFHRARYALRKASVPMRNLVAIVDPSVAHMLSTQANIVNLITPTPRWSDLVTSSISDGMQFRFSLAGFDVYESQYLKTNTTSETIDSVAAAAGVNNLFFSADSSVLPFIGRIDQEPKLDYEYNKDLQRDEWVMTCRYGFALYRPENLVVILTDTDQIYV